MALTKINSASITDATVVNADIADDTIKEVKLDVSNTPSAVTFLQYKDNSDQLTWSQASSPEVYGFFTDANGHLKVTTTNGGADNISATDYAAFEEVVYAATGFTWSIVNNQLRATI